MASQKARQPDVNKIRLKVRIRGAATVSGFEAKTLSLRSDFGVTLLHSLV